jgi:hypothetical protein
MGFFKPNVVIVSHEFLNKFIKQMVILFVGKY